MAATETAICNLSLQRMGQALIDDIDGTSVNEQKCNNIYDQVRDETLVDGPELGWKFAKRTVHCIQRESFTITAFASASATTTTVTATHTLLAGDRVVIDGTTSYDGTYVVVSVSTTVSFVITIAFVADDATGTAKWTSEEYGYRYAIPTSKKIVATTVGGIELTDWVEWGVYVLTNLEDTEVNMDIIQAITTVTLFPEHFVKVLVLKMAIELHYSMTQDLNAVKQLEFDLDRAMPKAIAMDERKKFVKESSSSWVDIGHTQEIIE
ncbi:hypothetical protein LCGC14_2824680 [marine sediment metagenome]|uniref:Uncharacterized protein n=1 Tax=marine sediment metagenome TaxID=412755 RepID=A0A0F8Z2N4_9ZZZZ